MESSRSLCFYWGSESKLKLFVRSCGEFTLAPPDRERCRTVDFGEIFWPIDGRGIFRLKNREFTLRPGFVWYYPPGICHDYIPKDTFHYCWLTIAGPGARVLFDLLDIVPGINRAGVCPRSLFNLVGTDLNYHTPEHRLNALSTAFRILTLISLGRRERKNGSGDISEIKTFIDMNCGDPDLSVEQIAANFSMHRGSLSRVFRKTYEITISGYIISSRLQNAANLLTDTPYSTHEIAKTCGFSSTHYFSKVFVRKFGVTPVAFRARYIRFSTPDSSCTDVLPKP